MRPPLSLSTTRSVVFTRSRRSTPPKPLVPMMDWSDTSMTIETGRKEGAKEDISKSNLTIDEVLSWFVSISQPSLTAPIHGRWWCVEFFRAAKQQRMVRWNQWCWFVQVMWCDFAWRVLKLAFLSLHWSKGLCNWYGFVCWVFENLGESV